MADQFDYSNFKKIIHVDMDAFFASVEQREHPEWRNKPLVVGSPGPRGVVSAASYEARRYGIRSAMPSVVAKRLCPHLIFAKGNFELYKSISYQIRNIFHEYTDLVEPMSLDEAYLDVTNPIGGQRYALSIAKEIKQRIFQETGLTASAGVSYNKFLAKIASDYNKPNGIKYILPENAEAFLEAMPIEKFHGIGKATAEKMRAVGIRNGRDLKQKSMDELTRHFGKMGYFFYNIVRGVDQREVHTDHERKSYGAEHTFSKDIGDKNEMLTQLDKIADKLARYVQKSGMYGRTLTLKVKYPDFKSVSRSKTTLGGYRTKSDFIAPLEDLLKSTEALDFKVRLLGLSISNLASTSENTPKPHWGTQLTLNFMQQGTG